MRYVTTRGDPAVEYSFADAALLGFPPNPKDGLFVPKTIPRLSQQDLNRLSKSSYIDIAKFVAAIFVGERVDAELSQALEGLGPKLRANVAKDVDVAELFNVPSLAFKDLAMLPSLALLNRTAKTRGERLHVLVATSGDTGPSALVSSRAASNLNVTVLFPHGRVAPRQANQMKYFVAESASKGDFVLGVEGSDSDALDRVARRVLERLPHVVTMNSFNISRVVFQIAHWAWVSFQYPDDNTHFVVPSGALGNAVAGYLAAAMGFPVRSIVVANNDNAVSSKFFSTGEYEEFNGPSIATLSPAMDINTPYNLERMLYFLLGGSSARLNAFYASDKSEGYPSAVVSSKAEWMRLITASGLMSSADSAGVADAEVVACMRETFRASGYVLDPHTAVGVASARALRRKRPDGRFVVLATASPVKFPEALREAFGESAEAERIALSAIPNPSWGSAAVSTPPPQGDGYRTVGLPELESVLLTRLTRRDPSKL